RTGSVHDGVIILAAGDYFKASGGDAGTDGYAAREDNFGSVGHFGAAGGAPVQNFKREVIFDADTCAGLAGGDEDNHGDLYAAVRSCAARNATTDPSRCR